MKVKIESHTTIDKRFDVETKYLNFMVDYDDVNHAEVDAALLQFKKIIEENWDENLHKELYKEELMKVWNTNEYGLQNGYKEEGGLNRFLKDNAINKI